MKSKSFSTSNITGKKYKIPEFLDDKNNIDLFLKSNINKKVIVVQGLGFVGSVMSLVCANSQVENYAVIGIDLPNEKNYWKIKSINDGEFPIVATDPKIEKLYKSSKNKNNFYASYDPYAYSKADTIIIDINLDVNKISKSNGDLKDYDVNLDSFKKAIKIIGENCKEDVLILVETTVPPGTCSKVVKPIIENCLEKRKLRSNKFKLGHSYERVMPGPDYIDSIKNFYRVYSGINKKSERATKMFLKTIISTKKYPLTKLNNTNSTELAKVLENSYRAMNIAFITEWSRFAEKSKVNLYEVIDAIKMRPTHSNMMYPGIGVGGYCLTKDPLLASWSSKNHFNSDNKLTKSVEGVRTNDKMPLFAFNFMKKIFNLKNLKGKKITLLGVSYRNNIADTRYTPVELFFNFCFRDGAEINLHDPYVSYWEELNLKICKDLNKVLNKPIDILVITCAHQDYKKNNEMIETLCDKNKMMILDTVGLFSNNDIKKLNKHNLKILGRGDL
tara:strand:+ start:26621 stop:28126 length:1506 start_codon:yes stop_codon:yes gene_type:complete